VAVTSSIKDQNLTIYAKVFSRNGSDMVEASGTGKLEQCKEIGESIGHKLIEKGGLKILKL